MALALTPAMESLRKQKGNRIVKCWDFSTIDVPGVFFTNHNYPLQIDDNTYQPVTSISGTAGKKEAGLKIQNFEYTGVVSTSETTAVGFIHLRIGVYRNVTIREFWVDWLYPWAGKFKDDTYYFSEHNYNREIWNIQVSSVTRWLNAKVGRVYSRNCTWEFGDSRCTVDLGPLTTGTLTVTSVTAGKERLEFVHDGAVLTDTFTNGFVVWETSELSPVYFKPTQIKKYTNATKTVKFQAKMPLDICVGDQFHMVAGCNKRKTNCKDLYSNFDFFGGFPFIPGVDRTLQSPNAK